MQFSTILTVAVFGLLNISALAAPQPVEEAHGEIFNPDVQLDADTNADDSSHLAKRGFGCNGPWDEDDMKCHNHCKSIKGYKGGYCAKAGFVCKCY